MLQRLPRNKANQSCRTPNTEGGSWKGYEKQKVVSCSWIGRTNNVEMNIPAEVAYILNTILIKIPMAILTKNKNLNLLPFLVMDTDSSLSCGERGDACLSVGMWKLKADVCCTHVLWGCWGYELGLILAPWADLPAGPSLLPVFFLRELCPLLLGKLWGILQRRPLEYRFYSSQQEVFVSWSVTILSVLDLSAILSLSQVEILSTHIHIYTQNTSWLDTPQLPRTVELQKPKKQALCF